MASPTSVEYDAKFWTKTAPFKQPILLVHNRLYWHGNFKSSMDQYIIVSIRRMPGVPPLAPTHNLVQNELLEVIGTSGQWQQFHHWVAHVLGTRKLEPNLALGNWWRANGLSFRFMDLPSELRLRVYELVSGPYIWPHVCTQFSAPPGSPPRMRLGLFDTAANQLDDEEWKIDGGQQLPRFDSQCNGPPQATKLPLVSRTIAEEFWVHTMSHAVKHFATPHKTPRVVSGMFRQHLRRISLGFSNTGYLEFLGSECRPHIPFASKIDETVAQITLLEKIPTLVSLEPRLPHHPTSSHQQSLGVREPLEQNTLQNRSTSSVVSGYDYSSVPHHVPGFNPTHTSHHPVRTYQA